MFTYEYYELSRLTPHRRRLTYIHKNFPCLSPIERRPRNIVLHAIIFAGFTILKCFTWLYKEIAVI